MSRVAHIKLHNVGHDLHPADAIECTIDDVPFEARFLRYGEYDDGNERKEWRRKVWVEIDGIREISGGRVTTQLDMFEASTYREEFIVNDAPGRDWHRTAGMKVEIE